MNTSLGKMIIMERPRIMTSILLLLDIILLICVSSLSAALQHGSLSPADSKDISDHGSSGVLNTQRYSSEKIWKGRDSVRRRQIRHLHQRRHAAQDEWPDRILNNGTSESALTMQITPPKQSALMQQRRDNRNDEESSPFSGTNEMEAVHSFSDKDGSLEFPDEYWVRIAQAKLLALAVENGTLPRLDEYSELMKPAGCRKEHDKECHEFTTKCAEEKADKILKQLAEQNTPPIQKNVTYYMNLILQECKFNDLAQFNNQSILAKPPADIPRPLPVFHCNSHLGLKNGVLTNFRMEYQRLNSMTRSSLSPADYLSSGLIPRYFVIELGEDGRWWLPDKSVQAYWLFRFKTKTDRRYRIRVTAVSPEYVYPAVTSPWINIYDSTLLTIAKPTDLHVVNITVDDTAARPRPSALMRWQSGSGHNASCDYDVFYMDDDMHMIERKKGDDAFWVKLDSLHFEKNYSVRIIEKFGGGKEANASSHLYIPSCLEMRRFSFDLCPPPSPSNIRLENTTEDSFWVVWTPPKYMNETNRILHYNLTVEWIYTPAPVGTTPALTGSDVMLHHGSPTSVSTVMVPAAPVIPQGPHPHLNNHKIFSGNVPGNETAVLINNVTKFRGQFKVIVTAVGAAGSSLEAKFLYFKGSTLSEWTLWKILTLVLALGGVVGLIVLFCLLKNFHEKRQRKKKRQEKFDNYEKETLQLQNMVERDATKWDIESCNLDLREGIGQGNFGLVRRAILNQKGKKMVVAVKTLRDGGDGKDVDKLWEEYEILKNLDPHVHVVGLKGIVTKHVPLPLLVVEFCDGGDLQSHLRKVVQFASFSGTRRYSPASASTSASSQGSNMSAGSSHSSIVANLNNVTPTNPLVPPPAAARIVTNAAYFMRNELADGGQSTPPPPLTIADLLSYARQIAVGMEYLSTNKIVHRDLAARNILLSGKSRILKISDFGLSRDVYEQNWYKRSTKGDVPLKWLALECILNEIYTTKSDVWAYGILLWEIFTYGGNPYPGVDNQKVFQLLKDGYRMPRPDACPEELYDLIKLCWEYEPGGRPDFTGIRLRLEEIIEKTTHVTYLNLESATKGPGFAQYKNCDSGFDEFEPSTSGNEPMLPPRNKKK